MSFSAIQNRIALAALLAIQSLTPAAHALELKRLTSGMEPIAIGAAGAIGGGAVLGVTKQVVQRTWQHVRAAHKEKQGWISFGAKLKATSDSTKKVGGCAGDFGSPSGEAAIFAAAAVVAASGFMAGDRLLQGKTQFLLDRETGEVRLNKKFGKSPEQRAAFPKENGMRKLPFLGPIESQDDSTISCKLFRDKEMTEPANWSLQISKGSEISKWVQQKQRDLEGQRDLEVATLKPVSAEELAQYLGQTFSAEDLAQYQNTLDREEATRKHRLAVCGF